MVPPKKKKKSDETGNFLLRQKKASFTDNQNRSIINAEYITTFNCTECSYNVLHTYIFTYLV